MSAFEEPDVDDTRNVGTWSMLDDEDGECSAEDNGPKGNVEKGSATSLGSGSLDGDHGLEMNG